jgi:hypothetical protein
MKKLLIGLACLVILGILVFAPIFQPKGTNLPEGAILEFQRVGGIAGFMDDLLVYENGDVVQRGSYPVYDNPLGPLEKAKISELQSYIQKKEYREKRFSLYSKIVPSKVIENSDMMWRSVEIRTNGQVIEIYPDSFIQSFIDSLYPKV